MERIGLSEGAKPDNYTFVDDIGNHADKVDFIQEAGKTRADGIPERPRKEGLQDKVVAALDAKKRPNVVIASSSSGIPSSQFINDCKNAPERVLIAHPFNPPHLMPLVELVPHSGISTPAMKDALNFYNFLGKSSIQLKQEVPGFVANRLQAALSVEAMSLVRRGIISAEDVDAAVTTSLGLRWAVTGPLMSNILGGGGGRDGFLKIQKGIGKGSQVWLDDMAAHQIKMTDENFEIIDEVVQKRLDHVDLGNVEEERDDVILSTMELKKRYEGGQVK